MEFDETPRFWYPRVALEAWMNFASCSNENLQPIFVDLRDKQRKKTNKISSLSLHASLLRHFPLFLFDFCSFSFLSFFFLFIYLLKFSMCPSLFRVCFCFKTIYLFSIHFILTELSSSHFPTSEIFVKIPFLKSLVTYHPKES